MSKCAKCGARLLMGKLSIGENRYCGHKCAFEDFFPRLLRSLADAAGTAPLPSIDAPSPAKPEPKPADDDGFGTIEGDSPLDPFKDLLIAAAGLAVVAGAAGLIWKLADLVRYPFYGQTFLFVLPLGAGLCGFFAGLGFLGAVRGFDRRPSAAVYLAAAFGGVSGYLLIYYFSWMFDDVRGMKIRDSVSFYEYLRLVVENQRLQVGRFGAGGKPIELGKLGYARFAINVLGFVLGVVGAVSVGGGREYCRRCRRYFKPVGIRTASSSDAEACGGPLRLMIDAVKLGRIEEALELQSRLGMPGEPGYLTTKIHVESCPGCGVHKATLITTVPDANGPRTIELLGASGYSNKPAVVT